MHRSFHLKPRVISWRQPQWPTHCCKHPPSMKQTAALLILVSVVLVLHGSVNADRLSTSLHSPPPAATLSGTVVSSTVVSFVGSGQAATSIYSALLLAWPTSAALGVQSSLRFKLARTLFKGTVFVPNDQASYGISHSSAHRFLEVDQQRNGSAVLIVWIDAPYVPLPDAKHCRLELITVMLWSLQSLAPMKSWIRFFSISPLGSKHVSVFGNTASS